MRLGKRQLIDKTVLLLLIVSTILRGSAISLCIPNMEKYILITIGIAFVAWIYSNGFAIKKSVLKKNATAFFLIICALPSLIGNWSTQGLTVWRSYFLAIILAFQVSVLVSKEELLISFCKVMKAIAIFSLICYVLFIVVGLSYDWIPTIVKLTDSSIKYKSLLFYNIWLTETTRNCGPFWEPSIFAAYLTFALQIRLFWLGNEKKRNIDCLIYILAMISTLSTGGYILLIITALMYSWRDNRNSVLLKFFTLLGTVTVAIMGDSIMEWLLAINYNVFSKIAYFSTMGTTRTRIVSILTNLSIWRQHPFVGVGLAEIDKEYAIWKIIIGTEGLNAAQTSTTFLMLAAFGVFGIYYTVAWLKVVLDAKFLNGVQKTLFAITIFFIVNQTPHTNFILTYFLLFVFLKKNEKIEMIPQQLKLMR